MSSILANIIIFLLWLWIVAMILPIFRRKRTIIITSLVGAVIGASLLWVAPKLVDGAFTTSARLTQGVTRGIITILGIISLSINHASRKSLFQTTIIVGLVAIIGQLVIVSLSEQTQGLVQFFFCIALIEERIKYAIAQHTTTKRAIQSTDILLFAILAALSYAWRENILIATQITDIIARTPTYLVHGIFTTIFVMGIYLTTQGKNRRITLLTITIALLMHTIYNIAHGHIHWAIRLVSVVMRYGALTYILSHTDSLYLLRRDTLATS